MFDKKFVSAVICAAGASSRMKTGSSKQFLTFGGMTVIERTVLAFENDSVTDEIIIVCPENLINDFAELFADHKTKKIKFTKGGAERQDSVRNGISVCNENTEIIAVHDGARPFITPQLIENVIADGSKYGCATLAVAVKDTIKQVKNNIVQNTPQRDELYAIQTPQVFLKDVYINAYENASQKNIVCTDDCRMVELNGGTVKITEGDYNNIKITTPEDIAVANGIIKGREKMIRVGHGYDVHKLGENRKLIIGGVDIPYTKGLIGHSDADVLVHAIMDAILGAAAMGDIGGMFPDTDEKYKGADSIELLKTVCHVVYEKGFSISNIDSTVVAQKPKLKPYIDGMRKNIANACSIDIDCVNVKATTEEKLGFTGREEGISAHAVCCLMG